MEKESKVDVNLISTCHGCLSTDRTIQPLAENSDMFVQMLGTHRQCLVYGLDDIRMCWECTTTLKKLKCFQIQVRRAQTGLMKMLYEIHRQLNRWLRHLVLYQRNYTEYCNSLLFLLPWYWYLGRGNSFIFLLSWYLEINAGLLEDSHVDSLSTLKITNKDYFDQDIKHRGHKKLKKSNEKLETITVIKTEFGDIQTYSDGDNAIYTDSNTDNIDEPDNNVDEFDSNSNQADNKLDEVDNKDFDGFDELIDSKKSISVAKEENVNDSFDVKEEDLKAVAPVKVKRPRRRRDTKCVNNVVGYYKRYASLVKTVKKDWGSLEDVRSHFEAVQFSEQEMEDQFITKDRRNISYERLPHKCEPCTLGYTKEDDLKRHNDLNHHKQGAPYKCTMCHKRQSSAEALAAHWKLHSVVFRCRTCGDVCKENFMRKHLDHAHTRTYDCSVCHAKFGTLKLFTIHYKQLHMTYVCDYCNHTLTTKKKMEKHISEHHMGYQCKECNRGYKNYIYYKKHCYSLHPHKVNPKVDLELSFCVECNKQFPSIDKYKTHLRVSSKHNKKKNVSLPCPECGKIFCRKKNLNYHYNLFHLKKTKYYCEICDKYFARPSGLRTHRQNVHLKVEKVKDKICDLCGRAFSSHVVLRHHRRTHTGERPHKCPHCAAEFIQKYAMQTHVRTQHKEFVNKEFGNKEFVNKDFVNKEFVNKDFVNKEFVNKDFVNKELNKEQQKKAGVAPVWPETGYFV